MRPYSPGGAFIALAKPRGGSIPPTANAHRLRRGLPGYLILFAPHAFVHERQIRSRVSPSLPVFHTISTHFTATPCVPDSLPGLRRTWSTACARFTPSKSEQRSSPLYYRGCWHRVSRDFLWKYNQTAGLVRPRVLFPPNSSLQPEGLHPARSVALSGFRPLQMILDCSLP